MVHNSHSEPISALRVNPHSQPQTGPLRTTQKYWLPNWPRSFRMTAPITAGRCVLGWRSHVVLCIRVGVHRGLCVVLCVSGQTCQCGWEMWVGLCSLSQVGPSVCMSTRKFMEASPWGSPRQPCASSHMRAGRARVGSPYCRGTSWK